MANIPVQVIVTAIDNASQTLKGIGGAASNLGNEFQKGAIAAGAVLGSLALLGKTALDVAGDMEQNRIAFETMIGSTAKAKTLLKEISDFAVKTPFELPQVVEGARRLLAYNIEAEKIIPTFTMLGNIASGVGREKLPQLILAFGQVKAATRLTGAELRQFSEAGVPLLSALATQLKKTEAEIQDMISNREVSFKDVETALTKMTTAGGKFNELMIRQSKSLGGIMSNIKDVFTRTLMEVAGVSVEGEIRAGSFFATVRDGAAKLLEILDRLTPKLIKTVDWISQNKLVMYALAGAIGGVLVVALGGLVAAIGGAILILGKFILIGAAIGATIYGLVEVFNRVKPVVVEFFNTVSSNASSTAQIVAEKVRSIGIVVQDVFGTAKSNATNLWEELKNNVLFRVSMIQRDTNGTFESLKNDVIGKWEAIKSGVVGVLNGFINTVKAPIEAIRNWISNNWATWGINIQVPDISGMIRRWKDGLSNGLRNTINKLPDFLRGIAEQFYILKGSLPSFDEGGMVGGAVGSPQLAVVHGGEKVISNQGGGGSEGVNLTVNVGIYAGSVIEKRQLAVQLWEELGRLARSQNKTPEQLIGF